MDPPGPDERGRSEQPARRRPGTFQRVLVIGFALFLVTLAGSLFRVGGIVGIVLGALTLAVALLALAVASGFVEWWAARRSG